jgi:hypothetical protein
MFLLEHSPSYTDWSVLLVIQQQLHPIQRDSSVIEGTPINKGIPFVSIFKQTIRFLLLPPLAHLLGQVPECKFQ